MSSYLYYILDDPIISDHEYDVMAKLLLKHYDDFEHMHKHLVTKADLEAGTLYHLTDAKYPGMVKGAARLALKEHRDSR